MSGKGTVLHVINVGRREIGIVPILVGGISKEKEEMFGRLLAPYLDREDTICVVSSDFCHWYVMKRNVLRLSQMTYLYYMCVRFVSILGEHGSNIRSTIRRLLIPAVVEKNRRA